MANEKKGMFVRFGLEMASVFIAVFLAFGVNEWRETRKNADLARTALEAIEEEIKRNKGLLEFMLPQHENVLKQVRESPVIVHSDADSVYFLPVILRNTAWRMASETGAFIHLPYHQATAIAEIYTFQEAYANLMQSMMASSFNIANYDENRKSAQREVLQFIAFVFVENEQMLIEAYDKALEELSAEGANR